MAKQERYKRFMDLREFHDIGIGDEKFIKIIKSLINVSIFLNKMEENEEVIL